MSPDAFREVWCLDFEFRQPDGSGERPIVLCLVAVELRTGRRVVIWFDGAPAPCPFDTGPRTLFVAYMATAELCCFLALGWPLPAYVLDLYVEFKRLTCGRDGEEPYPGLGHALKKLGLPSLDAVEKKRMQNRAAEDRAYTDAERQAMLAYCETDVVALLRMLPAMWGRIDWPRALIRGLFVKAAARVEHNGVPVDTALLARLDGHWETIQDNLIRRRDVGLGVYEGIHFRKQRFARLVASRGIDWPRHKTGQLDLEADTFETMSEIHPWLKPLRQLRQMLDMLRLKDLPVGSDGRNRCMLSPFGTVTGRCTPSPKGYLFGRPAWFRSLARPALGRALLHFDWSAQEPGIGAFLSGDAAMQADYKAGCIYLGFARRIGMVPGWATKDTHPSERDLIKVVFLAVSYGMGEKLLAHKIGKPPVYARDLLRSFRRAYPRFMEWVDGAVRFALFRGRLWTRFGWQTGVRYHHPRRTWSTDPNDAALANFLCQGNGAEMMRLAATHVCDAGAMLCATVHDAVLVECAAEDVEATAHAVQAAMRQASREVLYGAELKTSCTEARWPDHYSDKKGAKFWGQLMDELAAAERTVCGPGRCTADGTPTVPSAGRGWPAGGPPVQIQF
jgi:hypothetical protein